VAKGQVARHYNKVRPRSALANRPPTRRRSCQVVRSAPLSLPFIRSGVFDDAQRWV